MIGLDLALKATVVIAVAAALLTLMRRASAASRHVVLMAALAAAMAMPIVRLVAPDLAVPVLPAPAAALAGAAIESSALWVPAWWPETDAPAAASLGWGAIALAVWAVGVVLIGVRMANGWRQLRAMRRRAHPAADPVLTTHVDRASARLQLTRPVRVLVVADAMPMTWGLRTPAILLPSAAVRWEAARLDAVLLHELAHVRRRDAWWQTLGRAAVAVWWFHPLVWWAARRARVERERACDDVVLSLGATPSSYASDLLALARGDQRPALAGLAMARRSDLPARIHAILDPARNHRGPSMASVTLALAIAALSWPLAVARPSAAVQVVPAPTIAPQEQLPPPPPPPPATPVPPGTPVLPAPPRLPVPTPSPAPAPPARRAPRALTSPAALPPVHVMAPPHTPPPPPASVTPPASVPTRPPAGVMPTPSAPQQPPPPRVPTVPPSAPPMLVPPAAAAPRPPGVPSTPPPGLPVPGLRVTELSSYAGEWTPRDREQSDALFGVGLTDVPGSGRLVISRDASTLTIERIGPAASTAARNAIGTAVPPRSVYDLSGRPTTHSSTAGAVVSRVGVEPNRLVVRTTVPRGELQTAYAIVNGDLQIETTMYGADGRPGATVRLWYQRVR